ncbi:hypothetical protein Vadar_016319 [Vaccinium darrowii]|uniref:Uncharacterized protein n=1 Tax=Vaccinium darrowii TaxID=229202 RepID=A0ACB7XZV9_9ERIC|nr:hypothetical protein Vadar_016319 [Vaccinium darrowii]
MVKTKGRPKPVLIGGAVVALLMLWIFSPFPGFPTLLDVSPTTILLERDGATAQDCATVGDHGINLSHDPVDRTFYDDIGLSYSMGNPIKNWEEKRREWLKHHPSFTGGADEKVLVLTGSQLRPCKNPIGDNLLMRLFKNKVDYCRIHGYDIFYNNALLHPKMTGYWAKLPAIRAMMVAHPEAEWIFWIDSDAIFTDMDFKPPLEKYKDHNLVLDGWPNLLYEKKSWIAVNSGVVFIRNCQWSMEFLEAWAQMGPQTLNYEKWGEIVTSTLSDMMYPVLDDQSALIYLLLKEKDKWGDKIYIENQYVLSGYWAGVIDSYEKISDNYARMEKRVTKLRRRHAEKVSEHYAAVMREALTNEGGDLKSRARPFVTHFTGCQPCSGDHPGYTDEACWNGMEKTLNFADNQVLRNYGFVRPNLLNPSSLHPFPFVS